jgi:erythromycin esterase-like protein
LQHEKDLDPIMQEIGNRKIVLLGEASHGTLEYYTWRSLLTQRLVKEKGFDIIVVEGDWNALYSLNDYLQDPSADSTVLFSHLQQFDRWPQWLWANPVFADLLKWLHDYNGNAPAKRKVGVYGMDVFAFAASLDSLMQQIRDTAWLALARGARDCLKVHGNDATRYMTSSQTSCQVPVTALWQAILKFTSSQPKGNIDWLLQQQAAVVQFGETYFRTRQLDASASWNTRVQHMQQTIERMLTLHGPESKVIVWAHNTHVGDARYTDMPTRRRTNIGEGLRKRFGEKELYIIGAGSYTGWVTAAYQWGAAAQMIPLRPAKQGSWEQLLHTACNGNQLLLSSEIIDHPQLRAPVEQRAIGVVHTESYVPSVVSKRYDAFLFFDTTHALPLWKRSIYNNE